MSITWRPSWRSPRRPRACTTSSNGRITSTSPRLRRDASLATALRRRCLLKSNCASVWGRPVSRAIALPGVPPAAQITPESPQVALAAGTGLVAVGALQLALLGRSPQDPPALLRALGQVLVRQEGGQHAAHVAL